MTLQIASKTNQIEIDSFKIRIPMQEVLVLDNTLLTGWTKFSEETGIIDEEFKDHAIKFNDNGIKTKYLITSIFLKNKGRKEEFLIILINSKKLKQRYLEGITKDNISIVYDYLISQEVVYFTYIDFINSECTDVDFKTDLNIELDKFRKGVTGLKKQAKTSINTGRGCNVFNQKRNVGIEFSKRGTTAYKSNPFLKLYYKTLELNGNSAVFREEYLKEKNIDNLCRVEFTVKNKKHFRSFEIENTNLWSLLNLSNETKKDMLQIVVNKHLEKRIVPTAKIKDTIKPIDYALINSMLSIMSQDMTSFGMVIKILSNGITDRSARSRLKKKLQELYEIGIRDTEIDKETKELQEFYDVLGWEK